jgi:hypothetical protein
MAQVTRSNAAGSGSLPSARARSAMLAAAPTAKIRL